MRARRWAALCRRRRRRRRRALSPFIPSMYTVLRRLDTTFGAGIGVCVSGDAHHIAMLLLLVCALR